MKINRLIYFFSRKKVSYALQVYDTFRISTLFFLLFIQFQTSWAQGPPANYSQNQSGSRQQPTSDSIPMEPEEIDTANIQYFFPDNPGRLYAADDSLLNNYFQQYDPARKRRFDYFNLGRTASAAYPSVYEPTLHRGLDMGMHSFDLYQIKNEDIRFYHQTKAYSDVFYSGSQQENGLFKGRFARNFANGVNFTIDYQRNYNINFLNSQGPTFKRTLGDSTAQEYLYESFPRGRTSALGVGIWIHRDKYEGYFTYTANYITQINSGGIPNDTIFKRATITSAIPILITDARTRYEKNEIAYLQYYKLNKKDSTGSKRSYLASHRIAYKSALYNSFDPFSASTIEADTSFYDALYNDSRGLRFYLSEKQVENNFSLSTTKARVSKDTLKKVSGQNDWFEVGLTHSFHHVSQEAISHNFNNVILRGRWNFTPNDNIKVETYGHFNVLGYNVGDYRMSGELYFNLKNIGSITVKAINQLYEPSYIQSEGYLTQKPIWDNNFKKTLETHLSGAITIPRIGFESAISYTLLNNFVYFDKTFKPQQGSAPLSIVQLMLNENIKLGHFHLDNTITLQKPTEKFLRLPEIYSKNSFYVEGKVFKKAMLARTGIDLRYTTAWYAPAFMPLIGQFYVQEIEKVNAYPSVDVFLSFKVKSFRFFAKMENVIGNFSPNVYYQVYNYPVFERQWRLGISWRLLN